MIRLVFGCGYLGLRVASIWKNRGDTVYAVTRNNDRSNEFKSLGLTPIVGDITEPESLKDLPFADTVLFAVGMDRSRYSDIHQVYVEGLKNALSYLPEQTGHFIYVSSTGVYGDFGGDWVDESAITEPKREGGKACVAAEELLRLSNFSDRATILRFAGIYGPGRVPTKSLIETRSWSKISPNGYLNLIHVDDGARAISLLADEFAENGAGATETYLISDGNPSLRKDYYEHVARHFGVSDINWEQSDVPENDRSSSSKRISNSKFTSQFQFHFDYPNYKAGLSHALAEDG